MNGEEQTTMKNSLRSIVLLLVLLSFLTVPVLATDTNLAVPYYQQETDYYCGSAVAQMWIDFHNSFVSQNTLYTYIQNHNIESGWSTDPQGLEDVVGNYVTNLITDDHKWSSADAAIMGQAVDIVNRGIPSASLIHEGYHWNAVKGVSYTLYGGQIYQINGVWVQDPWYTMSANIYYAVNSWKNEFTQVDFPSSTWDNYWVTVQGYWGSRGGAPDYDKEIENIRLMDESEVSTPITAEIDIAGFAREQMNKQNLFQEELKGSSPGNTVLVHSLNKNYPDYYLIPFEKDGVPVVVSKVDLKGDTAVFSAGAALEKGASSIKPDLDEARKALEYAGYGDLENARLVWKPCEQTMSEFMPVWEFSNNANEIKYVGYNPFEQKVMVYDNLTPSKMRG
ncbi:C39 family peptidase [Methanoregula formicica]|nr:C39 family peptidase [Methanoregula formicica]